MINPFWLGFQNIFQINVLFVIFSGTFFGIIFGAIPGLTVTMGIALLLPFTFKWLLISYGKDTVYVQFF